MPDRGTPSFENPRIHEIVAAVSAERLERDVRTLAAFGTRHTLSDVASETRGVGAARRWLSRELEQIASASGGGLEVGSVSRLLPGGSHPRLPRDVEIVNPVAIQRGRSNPGSYVLLTAHYDSRGSDPADAAGDAPGANDNASGVAATLEVARLLSRYVPDLSIVYALLAAEEQGLFGATALAEHAAASGWSIEAVLTNDMIGNARGITGLSENTIVRVFAPGVSPTATPADLRRYLLAGGELDTPSRQLARRVARAAETYLPQLQARLIYRLDRLGRAGDHTPFFERGHPAVRITESHEDYRRQHRTPEGDGNGGDLPDALDFAYLARVTALNAATVASLAWAPPAPTRVSIEGAVLPSTTLRWEPVQTSDLHGYRIYWRRPTEPSWTRSRWVGNTTEFTLEMVVADDFFFGVAAVDVQGNESLVVYPTE